MTSVMDSARGASFFTETVYGSPRPAQPAGLAMSPRWVASSRAWSELIDDLLGLRTLEDDWDGQGAMAPSLGIVDGAITLAQDFRMRGEIPASRAIPGVNGTVFLEWLGPTEYCEVEVTAPDRAEVRVVGKGVETARAYFLHRRS